MSSLRAVPSLLRILTKLVVGMTLLPRNGSSISGRAVETRYLFTDKTKHCSHCSFHPLHPLITSRRSYLTMRVLSEKICSMVAVLASFANKALQRKSVKTCCWLSRLLNERDVAGARTSFAFDGSRSMDRMKLHLVWHVPACSTNQKWTFHCLRQELGFIVDLWEAKRHSSRVHLIIEVTFIVNMWAMKENSCELDILLVCSGTFAGRESRQKYVSHNIYHPSCAELHAWLLLECCAKGSRSLHFGNKKKTVTQNAGRSICIITEL